MQKLNLKGLTKRYAGVAVVDHVDLALQMVAQECDEFRVGSARGGYRLLVGA